jgi:hypothetical protein
MFQKKEMCWLTIVPVECSSNTIVIEIWREQNSWKVECGTDIAIELNNRHS